MTTVIGSIGEYFLLSDARATAKLVPEDARVALDRQLAVGRQRSEAADALWSNGHVAEGLRLAAEAFDSTVSAISPFAEAIAPGGAAATRKVAAEVAPDGADAGEADASEAGARDADAESDPQSASEAEGATEASAAETESDDEPSQAKAASDAEPRGEASDAEASDAEASDAQASDAQASDAQASDAEASDAEASDAEASDAEASDAEASDAEATDAEASDAEASDAEASDAEASDAEASDAEASDAEDETTTSASEAAAASAPLTSRTAHGADFGEPDWAALLRRRGLSEGKTREVVEAARLRAATALPLLDDQVSASDGELFQQLVTARRHVDRVLSPASMTPGQLAWTRVSRIGFASVIAVAAAFGLYLLLRPPTGVEATASGQWSAEFIPQRVVDDDEATEWLLPDRQPGWVDVRIMPPEHIDTLRLKNSHNRHYNDRATNEYTIEVFSNGQLVRTIEGSWQGIAPRPEWTEHELGVDDVERIRLNVRSWHRNGGGLAEIDWD